MIKSMKSPRRLAAVAVFAIVAMSAFGFAATNTFPGDNLAGDGSGDISGGHRHEHRLRRRSNLESGVSFDEVHFTRQRRRLRGSRPVAVWRRDARPTRPGTTAPFGNGSITIARHRDGEVAVANAWTLEVSAVS